MTRSLLLLVLDRLFLRAQAGAPSGIDTIARELSLPRSQVDAAVERLSRRGLTRRDGSRVQLTMPGLALSSSLHRPEAQRSYAA